MRTEAIHYCETCGDNFNHGSVCLDHEKSCERYLVGDRIEVFHEGKWWSGTVTVVSFQLNGKRFIAIRTDNRFDFGQNVDGVIYTGYDMGIWKETGCQSRLRKLKSQ